MRRDRYISFCHRRGFPNLLVLGLIILPLLWGCASTITVPPLASEDTPRFEAAGNFPHQIYRIEPNDALQIRYPHHPEMNLGGNNEKDRGVIVQPDGRITAIMVGEITVAGMTTVELEKLLVGRTSEHLRNPEVVVTIVSFAEKNIYVGGEVGRPGTIPYRKGLSPLQAIIAAGGFIRETAQVDSVVLVRTGGSDNNFMSRKLNLSEAITDGMKEALYLAPHDVLYVPSTSIADANLWVRQHITDIIGPLLGVGPRVGMGIRLNP